uniref:Uncharacterized protein n=1 Tax=Thermosporothrix sp. COM3 TaxID=2490863 RepID=A0A455SGB2_9CHLR|nr:hypothetical protein KTC_12910 [Thermosporothrix sp. COM3]
MFLNEKENWHISPACATESGIVEEKAPARLLAREEVDLTRSSFLLYSMSI